MNTDTDTDKILDVRDRSGKLCGSYHYTDPYKSFFRGLYTPEGLDVVSPPKDHPDHPHHKGLQYGLCATDVNFWEEDTAHEPDKRKLRIGRQVTKSLDRVDGGFSQEINWLDDGHTRFLERRRICVQPTTSGYVWTWQTTLTADESDVDLIVSVWDINPGYYGLGLRLMPELFLNKSTVTSDRSNGVLRSVTIKGTKAAVTFEQDPESQRDVLYIQGCEEQAAFAFVSLGPTNGAGFTVKKGEQLKRSYRITVADVT